MAFSHPCPNLISDMKEEMTDLSKRKLSRYGQHFMTDNKAIDTIIDASAIEPNDRVLEIGIGKGALTGRIAEKDCNLMAYEIDEDLKDYHDTLRSKHHKIKIIYRDILASEIPDFDILVSNLPYNISEPLLRRLSEKHFRRAVLTVNKSFAMHMIGKEKSLMSIIMPLYFNTEIIKDLPANSFDPRPRVPSSIILVRPRTKQENNEDPISFVLRDLFDQKTRKTKNGLLESIIEYRSLIDGKRYTKRESRKDIDLMGIDSQILERKIDDLSYKDARKIITALECYLDI